jgi:hypothetical protein
MTTLQVVQAKTGQVASSGSASSLVVVTATPVAG